MTIGSGLGQSIFTGTGGLSGQSINPIPIKKSTQPITLGRAIPINTKEPVMKQALANLVIKNESGPTLTNKFPELSTGDREPLMSFALDTKNSDSLTKISKHYPEFSDTFKQEAFNFIKGEQNKGAAKPSVGQNILGGILDSLSSMPRLGMNIADKGAAYVAKGIASNLGGDASKIEEQKNINIENTDKYTQKLTGGNPENAGWEGAKGVTDVIQMFTPSEVGVVEGLSKIPMLANMVKEGTTVAKVSRWLNNSTKARPIIQKITQAVTKAVGQGTLDATKYEAIANHKVATPEEALMMGAFNLALSNVIPGVAKLGGNVVKGLAGKLTGTSAKTIDTAIQSAGQKEFTTALRGGTPIESTLQDAQGMVENMKTQRNLIYGEGAKKLEQSTKQVDLPSVGQEILGGLEKKGIKIPTDANGNYILNGDILDFSKSTISQHTHQEQIRNLVDEIRKRNDTSALGADTLKQRIGNLYKGGSENTLSDAIITDASNKIGNKIKDTIPEYSDMMKQYAKFKDTEKDIKQALSLNGNKTNKNTAITKLMNLLNENKDFAQSVAEQLQQYGTKNLKGEIAGQALNPILPKGLMGRLEGIGLIAGGFLHPEMWLGLLASSPRLVGELSNIIGISKNVINTAVKNIPKGIAPRATSLGATKALIPNKK